MVIPPDWRILQKCVVINTQGGFSPLCQNPASLSNRSTHFYNSFSRPFSPSVAPSTGPLLNAIISGEILRNHNLKRGWQEGRGSVLFVVSGKPPLLRKERGELRKVIAFRLLLYHWLRKYCLSQDTRKSGSGWKARRLSEPFRLHWPERQNAPYLFGSVLIWQIISKGTVILRFMS